MQRIGLWFCGLAIPVLLATPAHSQVSATDKLTERPLNLSELKVDGTVSVDSKGQVKQFMHMQSPFKPGNANLLPNVAVNPQNLGAAYVKSVGRRVFGIDDAWIDDLKDASPRTFEVVFDSENRVAKTTTICYQLYYKKTPVWQGSFSLDAVESKDPETKELQIDFANSNLPPVAPVKDPDKFAVFTLDKVSPTSLAKALGLRDGQPLPQIDTKKLYYYYYDKSEGRVANPGVNAPTDASMGQSQTPALPLPALPESMLPNTFYQTVFLRFTLPVDGYGLVRWSAHVEVQTGAVLFLRSAPVKLFHASDPPAKASVLENDPVVLTRSTAVSLTAPFDSLNGFLKPVGLLDLSIPAAGGGAQLRLDGRYVTIADVVPPNVPPPSIPPPGPFMGSVDSDTFAAVIAYYRVDEILRLIKDVLEENGDTLQTAFPRMHLPLRVDHRADPTCNSPDNPDTRPLGAQANIIGDAPCDAILIGRVNAGSPLSIAIDRRVLFHEIAHCILQDHCFDPSLGFAHSFGDSLAAIYCDPGPIQGVERGYTFPWLAYSRMPTMDGRRHDRDVTSGWGWYGNRDFGGYSSEQILSTTMFRTYLALGGDAPEAAERSRAARYVVSLLIRAACSLPRQDVQPVRKEFFEASLVKVDRSTPILAGTSGGAAWKVIRWSFEKQGLRRPDDAAPNTEGRPSGSDVYIDDGRHGEYAYKSDFTRTTDIWNRNNPDGQLLNQDPITNTSNYLYVRVKNRGTLAANNVRLTVYQNKNGRPGQVWPDEWKFTAGTTTSSFPDPSSPAYSIPPGGEVVLGPIEWVPTAASRNVLASVSTDHPYDMSNIDQPNFPSRPILCSRLVPFDNNLAQRNFDPGGAPLVITPAGFMDQQPSFTVVNPFARPARAQVFPDLHETLKKKGWKIRAAKSEFDLDSHGSHKVDLEIIPDRNLTYDDLVRMDRRPALDMRILVDDAYVGGASVGFAPRTERDTDLGPMATTPGPAGGTFFIVRHAERDPAGADRLTDAGTERARHLAYVLKDAGIVAVYSSTARRTIDTAQPLADVLGLPVQPSETASLDAARFVQTVRKLHPGRAVFVVGHSDTIPAMLKALGVPETGIPHDLETQYNNLFVVTPTSNGPPTFVRLRN